MRLRGDHTSTQKNPNHRASPAAAAAVGGGGGALAVAGGEGEDGAPMLFFCARRGGVVGLRTVWRGARSGAAAVVERRTGAVVRLTVLWVRLGLKGRVCCARCGRILSSP